MLKKVMKIILAVLGIFTAILSGLFAVYFFNLDMKLTVNVIAPFLEKWYDKRERKQYV